mmetsp:Transcript_38160/g.88221  ORF Transcript_38160/g.88221 Transcript_38160/m.88221 type:complete len:244 (+) Transcript_38160:76-807(+)
MRSSCSTAASAAPPRKICSFLSSQPAASCSPQLLQAKVVSQFAMSNVRSTVKVSVASRQSLPSEPPTAIFGLVGLQARHSTGQLWAKLPRAVFVRAEKIRTRLSDEPVATSSSSGLQAMACAVDGWSTKASASFSSEPAMTSLRFFSHSATCAEVPKEAHAAWCSNAVRCRRLPLRRITAPAVARHSSPSIQANAKMGSPWWLSFTSAGTKRGPALARGCELWLLVVFLRVGARTSLFTEILL